MRAPSGMVVGLGTVRWTGGQRGKRVAWVPGMRSCPGQNSPGVRFPPGTRSKMRFHEVGFARGAVRPRWGSARGGARPEVGRGPRWDSVRGGVRSEVVFARDAVPRDGIPCDEPRPGMGL